MVVLLTDAFLLLTQVLLWVLIGLAVWFILTKLLPKAFLGMLVLILILGILALAFLRGAPLDGGILEGLWRVISFPFTPFGLGITLLLVLLSGAKLGKWARNFLVAGLLLLALVSVPIASYYLVRELETEAVELVRPAPALPAGARRVIVLLGQGSTRFFLRPRENPRPDRPPTVERPFAEGTYEVLSRIPVQLSERGDRLIYVAQLYREAESRGESPLIIASAGRRRDRLFKEGDDIAEISEARDIRTFLSQVMGIPDSNIIQDNVNGGHRATAYEIQKILRGEPIAPNSLGPDATPRQPINYGNQLMVVSSALSGNRAFLTFQHLFSDTTVIIRPTDFYTVPPPERLSRLLQGNDLIERERLQLPDLLPSADAFCQSTQALEEYVTALFYFLRGWIKPFSVVSPLTPTTSPPPVETEILNTPRRRSPDSTPETPLERRRRRLESSPPPEEPYLEPPADTEPRRRQGSTAPSQQTPMRGW